MGLNTCDKCWQGSKRETEITIEAWTSSVILVRNSVVQRQQPKQNELRKKKHITNVDRKCN